MVYEMTNQLIWSDFEFFFYFQSVFTEILKA